MLLGTAVAQAQAPTAGVTAQTFTAPGWQACYAIKDKPTEQLACYQRWAESQLAGSSSASNVATEPGKVASVTTPEVIAVPVPSAEAPDGKPQGCRDGKYSPLSKFWELQGGTDCGTFSIRGYRPITLAVVGSSSVNSQPTSGNAANNSTTSVPYRNTEAKIQLSVRTKLASGLLTQDASEEAPSDSLWFGYTQQSYWQLFTPSVSRPFRNTDHEPELIYIYPHTIALPGGWNYRLSGLGLVHQSNGQSLPLSRSWNRAYLMGAAEKVLGPDSSLSLQARLWRRLREQSSQDDNPNIEDYVGRGELTGTWRINHAHSLGLTLRHSLKQEAKGSARLDWLAAPKASANYAGLRYHVQLFSGYGDSLIDFNRKRTVLSVGLSLVDW